MNGTLRELTNQNTKKKAELDSSICNKSILTYTELRKVRVVVAANAYCVGCHAPLTAFLQSRL